MADEMQVKAKLVLDSNAQKVTDEIKRDFEEVAAKAQKATGQFHLMGVALKRTQNEIKRPEIELGLGRNIEVAAALGEGAILAVAAAAIAGTAAAIGFGIAATHAFMESEQQVRRLAGTFTLLDQNANTYNRIRDYASDVKDELEQLGIQAGVTDDELVSVFNDVLERGGKSVEQAQELTGQMALAGRAIPGGAAALSNAFEMIQIGSIKAKNPIVGMIAATGMLHGNAKAVAAQMMKMSPEEQMKLAEQAIARMSTRMEKQPLTIEQMATSMKVLTGNILEAAGQPIVEKLGPAFDKVRKWFMDHADTLNAIATQIGDRFGKIVEIGGTVLMGVFSAIDKYSRDIAVIWKNLFGEGDSVFDSMYENQKSIAGTIADMTGDFIKVLKFLSEVVKDIQDLLKAIGRGTMRATGFGQEAAYAEQSEQMKALRGRVVGGAKGLTPEEFTQEQQKFVKSAEGTQGAATAAADFAKQYDMIFDKVREAEATIASARAAEFEGDAKGLATSYLKARDLQSAGAMQNIASVVANSKLMQTALGVTGPEIFGEGAKAFVESLSKVDPEAAKKLKEAWKPVLGPLGQGSNINFNGGQTFNIKQDFRDQDPDRVMTIFRKDVSRVAANQIQAKTQRSFLF